MEKAVLRRKKKRGGFTLVELIVVIAILAVLAVVAVASYSNISETARINSMYADAVICARTINTYNALVGTSGKVTSEDSVPVLDAALVNLPEFTMSLEISEDRWDELISEGFLDYDGTKWEAVKVAS